MYLDLRKGPPLRTLPAAERASEAAGLLSRYPNVSETEIDRLASLYRHLPALEAALLMSDARLGPKLDRFVNDHRSKVRTPFRQYAVLVAIAVVGAVLLAAAIVVRS